MNKLKVLCNFGFKTPWKLLHIGLLGCEEISPLINREDIIEYLYTLLDKDSDIADSVIDLITNDEDSEIFEKVLTRFSNMDNSSIDIQKRKWRVYLLQSLLDNISDDSLRGMLELMEFWSMFGTLDNCPLSQLESNSQEDLSDYFSSDSYELNINRNKEWLANEISDIINAEL